jgi:hypothetical protein
MGYWGREEDAMSRRLSILVLAIIAAGVAHMGEQLITGIEEFHKIRDAFGGWYRMFPDAYADHASVILITIIVTAISLVFFALMRGGMAPLMVAGVFGLLGVGETHHWFGALQRRGYDPGLITSFAYVVLGAMILLEVGRESRARWVLAKPGTFAPDERSYE